MNISTLLAAFLAGWLFGRWDEKRRRAEHDDDVANSEGTS